jgi:predicted transcriptional regulator of viral defense system
VSLAEQVFMALNDRYCTTAEVAARIDVAPAKITATLGRLRRRGWADHRQDGPTSTWRRPPRGVVAAREQAASYRD